MSYENNWRGFQVETSLTPAVKLLLISTVAVSLLITLLDFTGIHLEVLLGLSWTELKHGFIWQPVTYLFIHAGFMHLLGNMIGLFFLGPDVERELGKGRFLRLYFTCGIIAGLGWLLISMLRASPLSPAPYCIGASGAVLGILGLFGGLFPNRQITLLLFLVVPVTMTARMMALGGGLITVIALMYSTDNVAHAAHLFGGLTGYLYGVQWREHGGSFPDLRSIWVNATAQQRRREMKLAPPEPTPSPSEIDRILDRASASGIESLSREERATLTRYSESLRKKDL